MQVGSHEFGLGEGNVTRLQKVDIRCTVTNTRVAQMTDLSHVWDINPFISFSVYASGTDI